MDDKIITIFCLCDDLLKASIRLASENQNHAAA